MTHTPRMQFAESHARAERERVDQQRRAVRTVARQARDRAELTEMLSMLGLDDTAYQPTLLSRRLAVYVSRVAAAIGVPAEATGYEVSDTATAYVGLDRGRFGQPDHDLMLIWDERLGWYLAVEPDATEADVIIAYLNGDTVPQPGAVARFVAASAANRGVTRIRPVGQPVDRSILAARMDAVCPAPH